MGSARRGRAATRAPAPALRRCLIVSGGCPPRWRDSSDAASGAPRRHGASAAHGSAPASCRRHSAAAPRGGQPGDRLAAPGHAPTPRRRPRSASSGARGHDGRRTCASSARAAARTAGVSRPTRPARARASCPRAPFVAGEQVTVTRARRRSAGAAATAAHDASRSRPRRPSARTSSRPAAATRAPSSTTARRPALTPSTRDRSRRPAQPGATPGDLFLAPYQGDGHARADDRRPERQRWCGFTRCRPATSATNFQRPAATTASPCSDLVAGTDPRSSASARART